MAIPGLEKEQRSDDTLAKLLRLVQFSQQGQKESPVVQDAIQSYSSYIFNSFDDVELESHQAGLDNWYNENLGDLTSSEIERYELVKRRIPEHQKRYKAFDAQYAMMHDEMEEMKVLLAGGVDEEGNTVVGYNDLDNQGKALLAGTIKEKELAYIKSKELLTKQFGDLLSHPSGKFTTEFTGLNSWDDIYQLGLASIEDHVLDKNELYTISRGIDYGNLEEYNAYKGIQEQTQSDSRRFIMQDARPLIAEVNYKGKLLDDYEYIMELAESAQTNPQAQKRLNAVASSVAHSTESQTNPYAGTLPTGFSEQQFTWQQLLDQEANDLIEMYRADIQNIQGNLYQLESGFQNVSRGESLTQGMPITYSGWGGEITDPYLRYEPPKKEDGPKNKVSKMSADEKTLILDYEKDYQKKQELNKWFKDYPYTGSSPEEKKAFGTPEYYKIRTEKSSELKVLKIKWNKKQTHSYGGDTWEQKPQISAYEIYKRYNMSPIGKMFD